MLAKLRRDARDVDVDRGEDGSSTRKTLGSSRLPHMLRRVDPPCRVLLRQRKKRMKDQRPVPPHPRTQASRKERRLTGASCPPLALTALPSYLPVSLPQTSLPLLLSWNSRWPCSISTLAKLSIGARVLVGTGCGGKIFAWPGNVAEVGEGEAREMEGLREWEDR